jgi:hypothetical protein
MNESASGSLCRWSYPPEMSAIDRAVLDGTRRGEMRRRAGLRRLILRRRRIAFHALRQAATQEDAR